MEKYKILVTGASGLLGYEACQQLNESHEIWAIDNHFRSSLIPPCSRFLELDLTQDNGFEELPQDFDYILHYGAINGTTNFYEMANRILKNNFLSDINVFEFAASCDNLKKIVYASSSEVVAEDPATPVPEKTNVSINDIHNPRWSYRLPKICAENYLANSDLPWLTVRYFNVYGSHSKPGHFVADQISKISSGVFDVVGSDEYRSFCHVSDAISATLQLMYIADKEVINVGNDQLTQIQDAVEIIADILGHHDVSWNQTPGRSGSTKSRRPDLSKLHNYLPAYSPRDFRVGMMSVLKDLGH